MEEEGLLYFAYGSNMDTEQMARRCSGATPLSTARLDGYEFFITVEGVASIREKPGRSVHGLLWRLAREHLAALDEYEGVADGDYARSQVVVSTHSGQRNAAWVYIATEIVTDTCRSLTGYLLRIVRAAKDLELPGPYLLELLAWAAGPEVGVSKVNQKKRGI